MNPAFKSEFAQYFDDNGVLKPYECFDRQDGQNLITNTKDMLMCTCARCTYVTALKTLGARHGHTTPCTPPSSPNSKRKRMDVVQQAPKKSRFPNHKDYFTSSGRLEPFVCSSGNLIETWEELEDCIQAKDCAECLFVHGD